jgi:hypothetical protein
MGTECDIAYSPSTLYHISGIKLQELLACGDKTKDFAVMTAAVGAARHDNGLQLLITYCVSHKYRKLREIDKKVCL